MAYGRTQRIVAMDCSSWNDGAGALRPRVIFAHHDMRCRGASQCAPAVWLSFKQRFIHELTLFRKRMYHQEFVEWQGGRIAMSPYTTHRGDGL